MDDVSVVIFLKHLRLDEVRPEPGILLGFQATVDCQDW